MIVIITAVFKVGGFKGKCSATQSEFILICVVDNRKLPINIPLINEDFLIKT
jgi:hypothetical protein